MSVIRKRGKTIHSSERELIRRVIRCCDTEAREKQFCFSIKQATERAAFYCQISKCTVKNIRKECRSNPSESLSTPGKHRKRPDQRNCVADEFDRGVILDVIQSFYVNKKIVPTLGLIRPVLKERIHFNWSETSLRRILKDMGFKFKTCSSKRKVLIERPEIINWRYNYLKKIKQSRSEGKQIFFLDETAVDSNLTVSKCWQHAVDGALIGKNASNRLIIVHIGSEKGFLCEAGLVYRAGLATGDYHGQMNSQNFEKWVREKVIPNLPPNSTVVMDNAPYHCKQVDEAPSKSAVKQEMLDWLSRHGKDLPKSTRKADLVQLIEQLKPPEKVYRVDSELQAAGHEVLRLPPYMCDLNAIEYAWTKLKQFVHMNNTNGDVSQTKLYELVTIGLQEVTAEDWAAFCRHVIKAEDFYWERDGIMEDAVDSLVINFGGDDSSESSSEDGYEDFIRYDDELLPTHLPRPSRTTN